MLSNFKNSNSKNLPGNINRAFTLIELLIVFSIIGLLFGLGYANFRGYQRKQTVMAAARQVEGDLRMAQEYADQGYKPSGCGGVSGYKFTVNAPNPNSNYSVIADCGPDQKPVKENVSIPSGMTLTPVNTSIKFKVLKEGLDPAVATTFTITSAENIIVDIQVSMNGVITLGFR